MKKEKGKMSRKEFLKTSSVALLGIGVLGVGCKTNKEEGSSGEWTLGKTGIKVPPVGFGASRTMEPSLVNSAIDAGFYFLDTGRSYSRGKNEFMVGEVIEERAALPPLAFAAQKPGGWHVCCRGCQKNYRQYDRLDGREPQGSADRLHRHHADPWRIRS